MKPSELIKEIERYIEAHGDEEVYAISRVNNAGTYIGRIIGVGSDVENGIIIEIDTESVNTTK